MPCPWTCLGSYHLVSNLDCTRLAELAGCNPQNMSELHHGSLRYTKGCFFKVVHTDKDLSADADPVRYMLSLIIPKVDSQWMTLRNSPSQTFTVTRLRQQALETTTLIGREIPFVYHPLQSLMFSLKTN
jgi:hypothetical protein